MDTTECDFCGAEFPYGKRHVVALPRPTNPAELVAVLWGCGQCVESAQLPTAVEVHDSVVDTGQWQGQPYLFVTL